MTHSRVAILIVTYNSSEHVRDCVSAAQKTGADILVIDNASQDETVRVAKELAVRLIANPTNRGFAGAVNQGVRATDAPLLLLLNPDVVLQTKIESLVEQCSSPTAAAAGGLLQSPDARPQRGFSIRRFPTPLAFVFEALMLNRLWPTNPVNWHYRCLDVDLTHSVEADQPAGAFLLFRRDAWETVGGWDEGFFPVWFEDVDFCKRLKRAGLQVFYRPEAIAVHSGGHSVDRLPLGLRTEYWYRSLLRYSNRHFRPGGRMFTGLGVLVGSLLRLCAGGPEYRNRDTIRAFRTVVKLALRSMFIRRIQFGEVLS